MTKEQVLAKLEWYVDIAQNLANRAKHDERMVHSTDHYKGREVAFGYAIRLIRLLED